MQASAGKQAHETVKQETKRERKKMGLVSKNFAVFFAIAFAAFAVSVSANSLVFVSPSWQQGCQCDPQTFVARLTNDNAESEVYDLFISGLDPDYFSYFATPRVEVQPHSSNEVMAFITPRCYADGGNYSFSIKAVGSRGSSHSLSGITQVVQCHSLRLSVTPEQSVCGGDEATFLITLKNNGIFQETGNITTDLPASMHSLADKSFNLKPGEEKQFRLYVQPPTRMPPTRLAFKVEATSHNAFRREYAALVVRDCSGLQIVVPPVIYLQPGEQADTPVYLINTGASDGFNLRKECPQWTSLSDASVTLAAGENKTTTLRSTPPADAVNKEFACAIRADSKKFGKQFSANTKLVVQQLYSASLSANVSGDEVRACKGEGATVRFTLSNTGKQAAFTLSASGVPGALSMNSVTVNANSTQSFDYNIDSAAAAIGAYTLTVQASNSYYSTSKSIRVTIEDCFNSGLTANTNSLTLCPTQSSTITLTISNKGTRADEFTLAVSGQDGLQTRLSKTTFSLAGNASDQATLEITAPLNAQANTYAVTLTLEDGSTATLPISVRVPTQSECRSIELIPQTWYLNSTLCRGGVIEIEVKNKGLFTETLTLSAEGVSWAYITPNKLTIKPQSSAKTYLYVAAPFSTPPGIYYITLKAFNDFINESIRLTAEIKELPPEEYYKSKGVKPTDYAITLTPPPQIKTETNAIKQVNFKIKNTGVGVIHDARIFVQSDLLTIANQTLEPIEIKPSEEKTITLALQAKKQGEHEALVRAVARETFAEAKTRLIAGVPTLSIRETGKRMVNASENSKVFQVTFNVTNLDGETIVTPRGANAVFTPETLTLKQGESAVFTASVNTQIEVNQTFGFEFKTNRGVYYAETRIESTGIPSTGFAGASLTGLFAGANATIIGFIIALAAGLIVVYLLLKHDAIKIKRQPGAPKTKSKKPPIEE